MKHKLLQYVCYRVVDTKSAIRSARNPGESSTMAADWTSEWCIVWWSGVPEDLYCPVTSGTVFPIR